MTLTYKLDLDILPLDVHTKDQVCMFVRSAVRVFTDRHTDDVKTITPVADAGCNNSVNQVYLATIKFGGFTTF